MKRILFILILLLAYTIPAHAQKIPRSQYTVLEYHPGSDSSTNFYHIYRKATLSKREIKNIESILRQCIDKENADELIRYNAAKLKDSNAQKSDYIIALKKYVLQYIVSISPNGEKIIWVNCFCEPMNGWKDQVIGVHDGGNCFFNVMINLSKKTYYDFRVNGWA